MIKINELKGRIVAMGLTQREIANILGITPKTFNTKLKKGIFNSNEIEMLIEFLEINDPISIFFAK